MIGFYEYPANFSVEQTNANAKIVSNRNIKQFIGPGSVTVLTNGESTSAFFAITRDATSIRFGTGTPFTTATPNTDRNFYLEDVGGLQYTLHHYTATTGNPGITVAGTGARLYRLIVTRPILQMNPNKLFRRITPALVDRAGVRQESLRGNLSVARSARSNVKREISFLTTRTFSKSNVNALKSIQETRPEFTFIRNSLIHYDEVYPASFGKENIQYPYGGWDWNAGYGVTFRVLEQ